ncbi:TIGR03087 family PEP-CTERM/XrtA system glycosyltransferase [Methyloversatilis sp.]|uniref:TIGR03087 family PEP-CTERM/XrtA system glycosyltransferase n=1 Tax=Methyloversatilis sp. TaxID=2569862 RepID=UPI002732BF51|nr:TIGR03087 family PEP-CTERM/XrtA system glycosyltransferase [Methyloversatilis sp.]MDP2867666.1 TIGR03087 family PEP-CTERM/XrtA system glycosyltransferase [Methyloversatilis sp.]MDP3456678.1 TIGR03087 family PEP-CTERM/XrtA system glycosyltransferase [Methyloversatilis sp.]MDP3577230.1 TIGR03087 family PEP-CTERM/XrtA system glycosyltransferase [Methyloversatilis sp.]
MEPLLFLAHRLPYPPNKGDKIRSYHLLKHLARRYEIHAGTFVDDAADLPHVSTLAATCAQLHTERIHPRSRKFASLRALATGESLSVAYYRSAAMQRWVDDTIARHDIRKVVVFCSTMAQYLDRHPHVRRIVDLVDVDSEKWSEYAARHRWLMSWLYRREARTLLQYEMRVVDASDMSLLVTPAEVALFESLSPALKGRVTPLPNGVDVDFFHPCQAGANPYPASEQAIVFTGAMDYWPNIDAASWFATDVMPHIRAARPAARFYIVGMNPSAEVRDLERLGYVTVTGRVDDVRPWVAHAACAVAPLRVARGIQNKVLEAMAMARPVVVSMTCAGSLDAEAGRDFAVASDARSFADAVLSLFDPVHAGAIGAHARVRIEQVYRWDSALAALDTCLDAPARDAGLQSFIKESHVNAEPGILQSRG